LTGATGTQGATGPRGATGFTGATGSPFITQFAEFIAVMPPDNPMPIAVGDPILFPQNGPAIGNIIRDGLNTGSFIIGDTGIYRIDFTVTITETGQLILGLDEGSGVAELVNTVVGRATGTSPVIGMSLLEITIPGSKVSVRNPLGNVNVPLTLTPNGGGSRPISARLIITKLR
jgi:hypothetical protein